MAKQELMTTQQAVEYAAARGIKVQGPALHYWCRAHGIAKKIMGKWMIKKDELDKLLGVEADEKETERSSSGTDTAADKKASKGNSKVKR